ncbi:HAMP domain-containing sensor histidine kinase [Ekhidna sp.]|jgi:two-component system phosphate regulon sensor histidine kinase PhoR|uniref:sensor histidine kinase n=1 Tax=Ekhidna sp. TaxID=2608089 RepID=UPI0032EF0170
MKNAHIRVLVILAILSLVGIIGTQVFWLNRAIAQQDQVFNHNVQVALRNVVESLCEANGKDFPSINPIEQVSGNYFIVRTNDKIDLTNLEYLISAEIKKRAITQDFEYGVYDCANDQMVYAENVNLEYAEDRDPIPVLKNDEYYFGVYFPEKSRNLFAGFDLWKFTTAISLVVIIFFGFALFVILRQKRLSEVQKDFINNVSHELKTPLATLTLASSTLNERTAEKDKKYVGIIQKEVGRLQKNVEDILHSALLESDRKIQKESVDLGDFLERLMDEVREEYASSMIGWDLKLNGVSNLKSNQTLLENVLRNLIDNAVKYGAKNIELQVSQDSKKTMISVIDDGVGIESKHHKKIFRKFYRIPEPNNQHNQKGFGLGLHIVSSLIRKLGGKIQLESEPGKGSTFKITLPNG